MVQRKSQRKYCTEKVTKRVQSQYFGSNKGEKEMKTKRHVRVIFYLWPNLA